MPGARCARGLVCNNSVRCAHERTGHTGITRHSPRNGFTAYTCPPRRPGFFATVARVPYRELDTSVGVSGPHDFAVRFKRFRQRRYPRPPHPRPTLMTLRNAPLSGRDGESYSLICISEKQKYFCQRGWTSTPPTSPTDLPVGSSAGASCRV